MERELAVELELSGHLLHTALAADVQAAFLYCPDVQVEHWLHTVLLVDEHGVDA
jgi:hypothetical protein